MSKTNYRTSHYIHLKINNITYNKMIKPNQNIESTIKELDHKILDLEIYNLTQNRKIHRMIDDAQERLNAGI